MRFDGVHVCWSYSPRSKKAILDYRSAHSKVIRRGIAVSCLEAAIKKSCYHNVDDSFRAQCGRLRGSGYPPDLLSDVAASLVKKVKCVSLPKKRVDRRKTVAIPYLHQISHNLKKVGGRYGILVVFSAPQKMSQIFSRINSKAEELPKSRCKKKRAKPFVSCTSGVIYRILHSCGKIYIGQRGRCLNDRFREHDYALRSTVGGYLSVHCGTCKCRTSFDGTTILGKHRDKVTREIMEAFHITKCGPSCVSMPSVALSEQEMCFLNKKGVWR